MELKQRARAYFGELQDRICAALEELDGQARFREDLWTHAPEGRAGSGGGITRVIADGAVLEKGGVNLSEVEGRLTDRLAERLETAAQPFYATGISLVLHPTSPLVPTVHMNLRYIELAGIGPDATDRRAWFGGGADLTPYYLFEEDAESFHRTWKTACDKHDPGYYPRFKKWCDEYFWNAHRNEARGIGGLFFDYLRDDPEGTFRFVQEIGDAFLPAYLPIAQRHKDESWTEAQKHWQLVRRGRYVEFNLIHDRGTLFGLETQGRTESILMSLPPLVRWIYDHHPTAGSPEARLIEVLTTPREWLTP